MPTSPTQLTLRVLRGDGWTAQVVEHWNPHARIRQDLFGIIDVLAVRGDQTMGVQTTSHTNVAARIRKIGDSPNIAAIREAGWTIRVHGWARVTRKGRLCNHTEPRCGCRWYLWRDQDIS